jgi:hypothetical protein
MRPAATLLVLLPLVTARVSAAECDHSGAKTTASPDGRWVATVQEEVCATDKGAAAGVNVDLAPADDPAHKSRVFIMRVPRSREEWPRVLWKSPTSMEVWVPNLAEVGLHVADAEGVHIDLKYCGDNPQERARRAEYQAALGQWMKDTTAWVQQKKADPSSTAPRPKRPEEPLLTASTCAGMSSTTPTSSTTPNGQ